MRDSREAGRRRIYTFVPYQSSCPDKEEYEILADVLREERAKNSSDSSMDDEDLERRTSKVTNRTKRTKTIDRDDKKLFLYHASAEEKTSARSDAGSDQKVKIGGLAQRCCAMLRMRLL
jgi:hypothetical protein